MPTRDFAVFSILMLTILPMVIVSGETRLIELLEDLKNDTLIIKPEFTGPQIHPKYHDNKLHTHFNCPALFSALLTNVSSVVWPPPKTMPPNMVTGYTMGGLIPFHDFYLAERQNGGGGYHWSKEDLENRGKKTCTCGGYNLPVCDEVLMKYKNLIEGKTGVVWGSQTPWAEAALLGQTNAAHVTTVEYMKITSDHPKLSSYHPTDLAKAFVSNTKFEKFDWVFSYSSIEHDGLGRYGDPLNPFGDLEYIARVHCMLKPGGIFFLGIPAGPDAVFWNAHRRYGTKRLSMILPNWELIDYAGAQHRITDYWSTENGWYDSPIFVLKKIEMHSTHHTAGSVTTATPAATTAAMK